MKKVKNIIYTIYGFSIHPIINTYFCFSSALYLFGSAVLYTIATYVGNPGGDENLAYNAENNNNYGHISDNYVVLAAINEKREEIALAAINEENIAPIGYNSPHSIDDVYILVHKSAINKNIAQNTGPISNNVENAAKKKKIAINLNNIDKDKLVNNSLVPSNSIETLVKFRAYLLTFRAIRWLGSLYLTYVLRIRDLFGDLRSPVVIFVCCTIALLLIGANVAVFFTEAEWFIKGCIGASTWLGCNMMAYETIGIWVIDKIKNDKNHWVTKLMKPIFTKDCPYPHNLLLAGPVTAFGLGVLNLGKTHLRPIGAIAIGGTAITITGFIVDGILHRRHHAREGDKNRAFDAHKMRYEQYTRDKAAWNKSWLGTEKNKPQEPQWPSSNNKNGAKK